MDDVIQVSRRGTILADVRRDGRATGQVVRVGVAFSPLVMAAQAALIAAGYDVGVEGADGKLGPKTTAAIKKYQKDNGLPVTGKVDDALMGSLGKVTGAAGEGVGKAIGEKVGESIGAGAAKAVSKQVKSDVTTIMIIGGVVAAAVVGVAIWLLKRKTV